MLSITAYTGNMSLEDYCTVAEAAKNLKVTKGALHIAILKGQLKAERHGNMYFIHKDELARYRREKRGRGRPKTKRGYTRKTGD